MDFLKMQNDTDGVTTSSIVSSQKIVPAANWDELTFNELQEQKTMLFNAWEYLADRDSKAKVDFLQYIHDIDNFINTKFMNN